MARRRSRARSAQIVAAGFNHTPRQVLNFVEMNLSKAASE
jgi:hypothetical protein